MLNEKPYNGQTKRWVLRGRTTARLYLVKTNLRLLRKLKDSSIDSIVTDPPYGISFMGAKWDYQLPGVKVWKECMRVLKPGGHLVAFSSTRTYHRLVVAIEDAGFEIRDQLAWVYGSGFPKSTNVGKKVAKWAGWGTALKPAWEPICLARKPFKGPVHQNILKYSTGAINIDACRVKFLSKADKQAAKPSGKQTTAGPGRLAGGGQKVKRVEMQTTQSAKGRWPANLMHDGSDQVKELFPYSKDGAAGKRTGQNNITMTGLKPTAVKWGGYGGEGSAARFFYSAKASKLDRGVYNTHPTVKPTSLMRWLVKLVTPPKGKVLDMYMGSGSTGKACVLEGFNFIGCDWLRGAVKIARRRIKEAQQSKPKGLFDKA
jgi:site-specific DNA-methyltransferase (adenine-specific)